MTDLSLFCTLLQNLLHLHVLSAPEGTQEEDAIFREFEARYCYHPALQPLFTAKEISQLAHEMDDRSFYSLRDDLGIRVVLFRFQGSTFLLGPFVHREADMEKIQALLLADHLPASYGPSIQLYYSDFPVTGSANVQTTVTAVMSSFTGKAEEYAWQRVSADGEERQLPRHLQEEVLDYTTLYRSYDLENVFLHRIENGDTENVLASLAGMTLKTSDDRKYMSAVYQDPNIALSAMRGMARKAAERGGASIVEIHEITQRAIQLIQSSKTVSEQDKHSTDMILELTEAVRRAHTEYAGASAPIRRVLEYLRLNYSQKITLSDLADLSGLSESYLTKTFKKEVGRTIFQYIAYLRCQRAAELLRSGDLPVQEISSFVGYEDNNYFVKVFRGQYGMTPTAYRQKASSGQVSL